MKNLRKFLVRKAAFVLKCPTKKMRKFVYKRVTIFYLPSQFRICFVSFLPKVSFQYKI